MLKKNYEHPFAQHDLVLNVKQPCALSFTSAQADLILSALEDHGAVWIHAPKGNHYQEDLVLTPIIRSRRAKTKAELLDPNRVRWEISATLTRVYDFYAVMDAYLPDTEITRKHYRLMEGHVQDVIQVIERSGYENATIKHGEVDDVDQMTSVLHANGPLIEDLNQLYPQLGALHEMADDKDGEKEVRLIQNLGLIPKRGPEIRFHA